MQVEVEAVPLEQLGADVLAAAVPEDPLPLAGPAAELDRRLDGVLTRLVTEGELTGEPATAQLVHLNGAIPARRFAAAGVGQREELDADAMRTAAAAVARNAAEFAGTVAWLLDDSLPLTPVEQARAVVEGTILGSYDPARWRSDGLRPQRLGKLVLASEDDGVA